MVETTASVHHDPVEESAGPVRKVVGYLAIGLAVLGSVALILVAFATT